MVGRHLVLGLVIGSVACGAGLKPDQYPDPMALLEASKAAYRRGDCGDATVGFQQLSFQITARDPLQAEIRYFLAECTLRDRAFLDAARAFRRIADEFPQHALAPDALLRTGDAYAELWRRPQLDPTYGENALAVWRELANRYPESTAARRAQLRARELHQMFAKKAFENGEFYMRFRAYDSAILYYQDLIANYPSTSFAPDAVLRLIEAYHRIGYAEERRDMCGYLRQYYPDFVPRAVHCTAAETP